MDSSSQLVTRQGTRMHYYRRRCGIIRKFASTVLVSALSPGDPGEASHPLHTPDIGSHLNSMEMLIDPLMEST
eukprot:2484578-Pyramimonas_sp.AAC.1